MEPREEKLEGLPLDRQEPQQTESKKRFRILKLEERIAPRTGLRIPTSNTASRSTTTPSFR